MDTDSSFMKKTDEFNELIENIRAGKFQSPLDIPSKAWMLHGWDQLELKEVQELFLPFIKHNLRRAKETMGIYRKGYENIDPNSISSFDDFHHIPALIKDSSHSNIGFRRYIHDDPYLLKPNDIDVSTHVYLSGGTKGAATPTFITNLDRDIESYAFARSFNYVGIKQGDRVLSTYNPTHKGGEMVKEACTKLNCVFFPRRLTDNPAAVIQMMKSYKLNTLITSQGPVAKGDAQQKGGGVDFLSLVSEDSDVIESTDNILIGGYKLIDELIQWGEAYGKKITSILGSSEALPQATNNIYGNSTSCLNNNLHLMNGPHYLEVLKEESGVLVPVKEGEIGMLAYTTIAREGTIYIRYFPGDQAKVLIYSPDYDRSLKTPILTDIKRIDNPEDVVSAGCCIG